MTNYTTQYLIVFYETKIQVFSIYDGFTRQLQDFGLQTIQQIKRTTALSTGEKNIFFSVATQSTSDLYYLFMIPPQNLIKMFLQSGQVSEAISVVENNFSPEEIKIEKDKVYFGVVPYLIKKGEFKAAKENLCKVFFDPREFLILFPEYIVPSEKEKNFYSSTGEIKRMEKIAKEEISERKIDLNQVQIDPEKQFMVNAKEFFLDIMEYSRQKLIDRYEANEGEQKSSIDDFVSMPHKGLWFHTGVKMNPTTFTDLMPLVDFALLKAMFESKDMDRLKKFLSQQKTLYCKAYEKELI